MCLSKICLISLVVFFCAANASPLARLRRSAEVNSIDSESFVSTTTAPSPPENDNNPDRSGDGNNAEGDIPSSKSTESVQMPDVNQDVKHEDVSNPLHPHSEEAHLSEHNIHSNDDGQKQGSMENLEQLKSDSHQTEQEQEKRPEEDVQEIQGHPPVYELMPDSHEKEQSEEATEKAIEKSGDQTENDSEVDPQTNVEHGHSTEEEKVEHKNEEAMNGSNNPENHKEESLNSNQAEKAADSEKTRNSGAQTHSSESHENEFARENVASEEHPKESLSKEKMTKDASHSVASSEKSTVEHHPEAPKSLEQDPAQQFEGEHSPERAELGEKSSHVEHVEQPLDAEDVPEEVENHKDSEEAELEGSKNGQHKLVPGSVEHVEDSKNSNEPQENSLENNVHLEGLEKEHGNNSSETNEAHPEEPNHLVDPLKEFSKEHVHPEANENTLSNEKLAISSEMEASSDEATHLGPEKSVSEKVGEPDHQSEEAVEPEAVVEPAKENEGAVKPEAEVELPEKNEGVVEPEEAVDPAEENEGAVEPKAVVEPTEHNEGADEPSSVEKVQELVPISPEADENKPVAPSPAQSLFGDGKHGKGSTHNAFNINQTAGKDANVKIENINN